MVRIVGGGGDGGIKILNAESTCVHCIIILEQLHVLMCVCVEARNSLELFACIV